MAGASSAVADETRAGQGDARRIRTGPRSPGADHPDVVVVDADVSNSTRTEWFGKKFPDRFFNIGIAESNLVGVAAGLAASGKTSVIASFAAFITCNAYDQLRMSVAYPGLERQGRGQPCRDLDRRGRRVADGDRRRRARRALCPGFVVIVPADEESAKAATAAMLELQGPGLSPRGPPGRAQDLHRRPGDVRDRQGEPAPRRVAT